MELHFILHLQSLCKISTQNVKCITSDYQMTKVYNVRCNRRIKASCNCNYYYYYYYFFFHKILLHTFLNNGCLFTLI